MQKFTHKVVTHNKKQLLAALANLEDFDESVIIIHGKTTYKFGEPKNQINRNRNIKVFLRKLRASPSNCFEVNKL